MKSRSARARSSRDAELAAALLQPAPEPFVSVIPPDTTLKGFYLSPEGVAFVDLSAEASRGHRGALDEIFAVYSIVNTLTDNLPAIIAVQLLVDGRQVDTLAGHVDVRRPVVKDLRWTELPQGGDPPEAATVKSAENSELTTHNSTETPHHAH